jgi:hypothetical protein
MLAAREPLDGRSGLVALDLLALARTAVRAAWDSQGLGGIPCPCNPLAWPYTGVCRP